MNKSASAWIHGMIGVTIFSGSLPATRVAITGFDPVFLTTARAAIAGLLGIALLVFLRARRPKVKDLASLTVVALGVVVGFPLFSAFALESITAARSLVFVGLLPLATAFFGVLRAGERPKPLFWCFTILGSLCVVAFALTQHAEGTLRGDLLMLAAIITCGYGYAEGGRLARDFAGWQVISWALALSLPVMLGLSIAWRPTTWQGIQAAAWIGLIYVSVFSMLVGFFFWYHGLARGGIASVGQLQLLQPFLGLMLAALILHEHVDWTMILPTAGVVICVAAARRFA